MGDFPPIDFVCLEDSAQGSSQIASERNLQACLNLREIILDSDSPRVMAWRRAPKSD